MRFQVFENQFFGLNFSTTFIPKTLLSSSCKKVGYPRKWLGQIKNPPGTSPRRAAKITGGAGKVSLLFVLFSPPPPTGKHTVVACGRRQRDLGVTPVSWFRLLRRIGNKCRDKLAPPFQDEQASE